MDAATRDFVRRRAGDRCEYCLLRQEHSDLTHHVEHIVAKQHGGSDNPENLALACHRCNFRKGPNLTGLNIETGEFIPLYHPRLDQWTEHFAFRGTFIEGLTPVGRVTVHVLALNDARRLEVRAELIAGGELL
jgi:hypothetical protein